MEWWQEEAYRRERSKRFNIIGFSNGPASSNWHTTKHCPFHVGTRLIPAVDTSTGERLPGYDLMCPRCGSRFAQHEQSAAPTDESIIGKFKGQSNNQTRIITGKKHHKKYYDKSGNLINDPDLIAEIERGAHVISYNEQLPGQAKETQYDKNTKRLIRNRKG